MLRSAILALLLLGGCGRSLDVASLVDPREAQRRGAVEVAVKSAFPGILDEIAAGGGPGIDAALAAADVPAGDRPARILQLDGDLGLYAANPSALAAAILVYGG